MADRYRAAPNVAVELRTLVGAPISAQILELQVDGAVVTAVLELTGESYARAAAEGQLGLDAPGRGPGPEPASDRPVRLAVRLRDALVGALAPGPDPMHALLRQLFEPPAVLAHADAWRALDVTQRDVDQPAVLIGYRTGWSAAPVGAFDLVAPAALEALGLAPELVGDGLWRATPPASDAPPWTLLVRTDEAFGLLAVYGVLAALVPAAHRADAAVAVAQLSTELAAGGFDLDPEDGEVRFRIEHVSADGTASRETVERMVRITIGAFGEHAAALAALVAG